MLEYFYELDGEDQCGVGRYVGAGAALAVGERVGDVEFESGTFAHQLHALGPAGDDLVEREFGGGAAAEGGVEDRAVEEGAFVVAADGVGGFGLAAGAFFDHLVLQAAGGDGDAGLGGVLLQEGFALGAGGAATLGGLGLLALLQLAEEVLQHLLHLGGAHLFRPALHHVADGGGIVVNVQALSQAHTNQLVADVVAKCIAKFIHDVFLFDFVREPVGADDDV